MFWKQRRMARQKRVYADAAAATPLSNRSRKELERLLPISGNAGALHKEGVLAKKELEAARKTIADAIGAHADEIIFTGSGTEANNLALKSFSHVVTSAIEHQSVLEPAKNATLIGVDAKGLIDLAALNEALTSEVDLVSVQLVNSEIGTIEPVREISKLLRRARQGDTLTPGLSKVSPFLHTDASQAPLWMDIKVERLGVDLMTLDAQKVLGPKGIGCLYVKRGTPLVPLLEGGKQERGLRGGTENIPLAGAFAVALEDAQTDIEERVQRVAEVRDYLWKQVKELLPEAIMNGPIGEHRVANNLSVSIPGLNAEMAVVAMDAEGVAVSTRSACEVGKDEPSHVIKAIGVPDILTGTAIRISLLPDATEADAKRIANTLAEIAQRYRNVL